MNRDGEGAMPLPTDHPAVAFGDTFERGGPSIAVLEVVDTRKLE